MYVVWWNFAGDVPVCDPEKLYSCMSPTLNRYARDNEASNCNCPRQCRRLNYQYSISQAKLSNFIANFARNVFQMNETIDEIIGDHASLEVSNLVLQFSISFAFNMHNYERYRRLFNRLKRTGIRWLHFKVFSVIQVYPTFLISDVRALWRSGLSARVLECQKLKM